jgi:hypothetical protein
MDSIVVPTLTEDCIAAIAIRNERLKPQVVIMTDDLSYSRLLTQLWNQGQSFILVEHDIIVWPGALAALSECSKLYCGYQYQISHRLGGTLGCTRFSKDLILNNSDFPKFWADIPWHHLDGKVAEAMLSIGIEDYHIHYPPVTHLHVY